MKISHSAIKSSIFQLVKTVEVDIQLADHAWSLRIELFQDTDQANHFRCHAWESELFRLTPSFPRDENNLPAHITDGMLLVERGIAHQKIDYPLEDIVAPNVEAALEVVLDDLKRFLEHATREAAR